jgi:hypothetical protein
MDLAISQAEIPPMGCGPLFIFTARHLKAQFEVGKAF